jgi:hypothetical protein
VRRTVSIDAYATQIGNGLIAIAGAGQADGAAGMIHGPPEQPLIVMVVFDKQGTADVGWVALYFCVQFLLSQIVQRAGILLWGLMRGTSRRGIYTV